MQSSRVVDEDDFSLCRSLAGTGGDGVFGESHFVFVYWGQGAESMDVYR